MNAIPDISTAEIALRLVVAAGLTGLIGLERELRDRTAGLRTHMLVGVGAALFTIVSAYGWGDFFFSQSLGTVFDPTRIAAQIVSGIGFLGAGAIIRQGIEVRGLTTAAGLWVVAAIGMAAGAGFFVPATIGAGLALLGLRPLRLLGRAAGRRAPARGAVEAVLAPAGAVGPLVAAVEERHAGIAGVEVVGDAGDRTVRLDVVLPSGMREADLVEVLAGVEGVRLARWVA